MALVSDSTGPCPENVRRYRPLNSRRALPFFRTMNAGFQLEKVVRAGHVPRPRSTQSVLPQCRRVTKSLIETAPRIEIGVTHSFKRRKYFLIETRMCVSSASRCILPGGPFYSMESLKPIQETAKINRQPELVERIASYSKQRAIPQINRQLPRPESAAVRRSNGSSAPFDCS